MEIKILGCEKADNCFANAKSYIYTLSSPVNDALLEKMSYWGRMKVRRDFRRPFFMLNTDEGIQLKGVLNENVIKAGFPEDTWEEKKSDFERRLCGGTDQPEVMGKTESVCPVCLRRLDAQKVQVGDQVYLEKSCPEHGDFRALIWNGPPAYRTFDRERCFTAPVAPAAASDKGCPDDCGLCPEHRQRTCCVLLEVTNRCNLECPVCFAASQAEDSAKQDFSLNEPNLENIRHRFQAMMHMGGPFNIQLSGGEPAMRDDLAHIIRMGKEMGFPFFQLNTNGIRIGKDFDHLKNLADAGLDCVFLQFDGLSEETYRKLRGRELLQAKLDAIAACQRAGVGVVLVPVIVPGVNDGEIGHILDFALEHMPVVRGVHFQPASHFGRYDERLPKDRYTLPELLRAIEVQTKGQMKAKDFSPGNAENPYCSFSGNFILQADGTLRPWRTETSCGCGTADSSKKAREFVAKQWSAPQKSCCCTDSPSRSTPSCCDTSSLDNFLDRLEQYSLAVSAMGFMDAWTLDLERLKECYIHVVTGEENVRLIPFCAYNLTAEDGTCKYRGHEKGYHKCP
ncbi:radical SAM (seleno)protein TrsS [Blautia sp.]|uniref:radical SAM (seleno)protein TrsS n=1 Tax=Blautia sp. TaxID=1955243 RepID=UPI0025846DC1|nr:radical SAM (seleno)protein TrsS [Blautia sp.]